MIRVAIAFAVLCLLPAASSSNGQNSQIPNARAESVVRAWNDVATQYHRRSDLVPNIINTIRQGDSSFPQDALDATSGAQTRAAAITLSLDELSDPAKLRAFQEAQSALDGALGRLFAISENYPQLSTTSLRDLYTQLRGVEGRITASRRAYNSEVQNYNTSVRQGIIAGPTLSQLEGGDSARPVSTVNAAPSSSLGTCVDDANARAMHYSLYYESYKAKDYEKAMSDLGWILRCSPGFAGASRSDARNLNRALEIVNHFLGASANGLTQKQKEFGRLLFSIPESAMNELGVDANSWNQVREQFDKAVAGIGNASPVNLGSGFGNQAGTGSSGVDTDQIYMIVEDMPELVGGLSSIQSKIHYPLIAQKAGLAGRVFVQFVVDRNGNPLDVHVVRGVAPLLDREALRAVSQAKFKPGRQRGVPVNVKMSLPITFRPSGACNPEVTPKPFVHPAPGSQSTTLFGGSRVNRQNMTVYHTGVDYAGIKGSSVVAASTGNVVAIVTLGNGDHGLGNTVIISHTIPTDPCQKSPTQQYYTMYSHLDSVTVKQHQTVEPGEEVGKMGKTGTGADGVHLHFEVKQAAVLENPIDPLDNKSLYWGYVPTASVYSYGYLNPESIIGAWTALPQNNE